MNVLKDCIVFLIWTARILIKFYLRQKQRFSVWSFTKNSHFNFFHRASLKQAKNYLSKNNKSTLKGAGFKENFKHKEAVIWTFIITTV